MAIFKFVRYGITIYRIMRIALFIILLLCIAGCTPAGLPDQVENDIDSVITLRVPDQREALFSYTVEMLKGNSVTIKGETSIKEVKKEIIDILEQAGYEIYDSLLVLPDTTETKKTWGLVTVSVCNIKSEPSYSSELVSQALMGTPVKILKTKGSWLLIQTPDYYLGWTTGGSIVKMNEMELDDWKLSDRLIYQGKSGEIVSEKDQSEVVSDITSGAIIKLISERQGFYVVELPDGRRGCLNRSKAEHFDDWCTGIKPEPESMIKYAKSFLGYPYLWGGMSAKAFDCSGFVKTIYFTGGLLLARDASLQYLHGKTVDISSSFDNLMPGDLLFFGYLNDKEEERIIHVGMYIGDMEVIHSSGMVKINSIDPNRDNYSSYLGETLRGARRVIGEESQKGMESVKEHLWYNK
jgi:hypothetical protein